MPFEGLAKTIDETSSLIPLSISFPLTYASLALPPSSGFSVNSLDQSIPKAKLVGMLKTRGRGGRVFLAKNTRKKSYDALDSVIDTCCYLEFSRITI